MVATAVPRAPLGTLTALSLSPGTPRWIAASQRARALSLRRTSLRRPQKGQVLTWGIGSQGQLGRLAPFQSDGQAGAPTTKELFTPTAVPLPAQHVKGTSVAAVFAGEKNRGAGPP